MAAIKKFPKWGVLYLHRTDKDYRCRECALFIPAHNRCYIHSPNVEIKPNGYCGYWVVGKPMPAGTKPVGSVSKVESGYGEDFNGTTCAKCEYFDAKNWDCEVVDKDSPGDDPGEIHPHGCCARQSPK